MELDDRYLDLSVGQLAAMIDYTDLKAFKSESTIAELCSDAIRFKFHAVCVNPVWVTLCSSLLKASGVKVDTVVGFPLGASKTEVKAFEAERAVEEGAEEIDMVMNIGALRGGDYQLVEEDIRRVVEASGGAVVKVILETCYLTKTQIVEACKISKRASAHFVKTSTGWGPEGASEENVFLMRQVVGDGMGVKASGGIRTFRDALRMIRAGADRIGSSSGVAIVEGYARSREA